VCVASRSCQAYKSTRAYRERTWQDDPALTRLRGWIKPLSTSDSTLDVELEPLDFVRRVSEAHIADERTRLQVVRVFERAAASNPPAELSELLRIINVSPTQENQAETDAINIMSMHQAKGLTADATFVIAAEEEYLPGRATGSGADDERRLLYVSLTRARHFLFITHCRRRIGPQRHSGSTSGKEDRNLSSFLRGGPIQSRDGPEYVRNL
jgi:superfamily I DNA/RNA helicase